MLDFARAELAPASDESLVAALTQTIALLGQGMSEAERVEWIAAAVDELQSLPGDWAIDGLRNARKTCKWIRDVVPSCFAYAEDYPERARRRLARLEALATAAGVDGTILQIEHRR